MNYAPAGKYLWDPWFIEVNGKYHLFHLQSERNGKADNWEHHHDSISIGHAVSADLKSWETLPNALNPGGKGDWDEASLWTGSIFVDNNKYYLFYTGLAKNDKEYWTQRIGIAISNDLINWQKLPDNPILQADGDIYQSNPDLNTVRGIPAFRDPFIYKADNKYYMLFTARAQNQSTEYNGCIGLAESENLLDWKLLPPLLAPHHYEEMEVPQLIVHQNKFYLFFSASKKNTEPTWARERGSGHGLHCYVSKHFFGQYLPVNGNGAVTDNPNLLGLRLIDQVSEGYRVIGWIYKEHNKTIMSLSDPQKINLDDFSIK